MPVRLPLDPGLLAEGEVQLDREASRYLRTVLRLGPGDRLEVFDGAGRAAPAEVVAGDRRGVTLRIGAVGPGADVEARAQVTLLFGVTKGDGPDRLVRAATELGVGALWPVITARSVARPPEARRERWLRIAESAARQCGRSRVPEVRAASDLEEALAAVSAAARIVPWEEAPAGSIAAILSGGEPDVALLIGPEGGLAPGEIELARSRGFATVRLGPRILRAGTAAIAALTLTLGALGDLG